MTSRARSILLVAAALAVAAAAGLWLRSQEWPKHRLLIREGVAGRALVTAKGVGDPRNVHYTYSAGGALHSGVGRAGYGTPPFDALDVDDEVLIFYAQSDPGVSVLGDPGEHMRGHNRLLALIILLVVPALIAALMGELRRQSA